MSITNEAIDLGRVSKRRSSTAPKAGSVWESRMKIDEVKGGIKVFNAENSQENDSAEMVNDVEVEIDNKKVNTPIVISKQSPIQRKTWKSEGNPIQIVRRRSEMIKNLDEKNINVQIKKTKSLSSQSSDDNDKNSDSNEDLGERNVKSEGCEIIDETSNGNSKKSVSVPLVKAKTGVVRKVFDESPKSLDDDPKKVPIGIKKSRSVQECKEFGDGECEEKPITGSEEEDVEKNSLAVKKISVRQQNTKKILVEEKKLLLRNERPVITSPTVKNQAAPSVVNHAKIHQNPTKDKPDNLHGIPRTHRKLQSFADLFMWRDVSKSAFVFGIGTFGIISSSYTKDLNISFISVLSYLGLVYLAAIFLFRSLITRGGGSEITDDDCVFGEEEAVWLMKLVLPFINDFLLKLRSLFSGDPGTTMKLAVLLFILARCGSSITIWKMAKLGFFGVFTVPKVCCSYSSQLNTYGTFWLRRFKDVWMSCSHKKALGFALFTLVWNMSSLIARIWAVFMLFVVFKYSQRSIVTEGWVQEEAKNEVSSRKIGGKGQGCNSTLTEIRKIKNKNLKRFT